MRKIAARVHLGVGLYLSGNDTLLITANAVESGSDMATTAAGIIIYCLTHCPTF